MKRFILTILAAACGGVACGGSEKDAATTPYYWDLAAGSSSTQDQAAAIGKSCTAGSGCMGGMVCTSYMSSLGDRECEMLAGGPECEPPLLGVFATRADAGEPINLNASDGVRFCVRTCLAASDCLNGQCCTLPDDPSNDNPGLCQYNDPAEHSHSVALGRFVCH